MTADATTDNPSYAQLTTTDGLEFDGDDAQPAIQLQFDCAGSGQMVFKIFKCRWKPQASMFRAVIRPRCPALSSLSTTPARTVCRLPKSRPKQPLLAATPHFEVV